MIHIKRIFPFVLLLTCFLSIGQNPDRQMHSFSKMENGVGIQTNDGYYELTLFSENIVETTFIPNEESRISDSHALVLKPEKTDFTLVETEDKLSLKTNGIQVVIHKYPFQIHYSYKSKPLISEGLGFLKNDTHKVLNFNLNATEAIYGGGARVLGMNRRGYRLELYNRAHYGYETHSELMNYTMPMVLSSNIYAVHFDNAPIGFLDIDSKNDDTLSYETISGNMTYQVIAGDTWMDLLDQYTQLTGRQPMIPRWGLGNFSSRFGYHSERETKETIQRFKKEKIPVDAVILDLYWFGKEIKGTMGNLEFYRDSFPKPEKMIADLKKQGIKTILVTEPFILTSSNRWQEAVDADILSKDANGLPYTYDFYFGNTGLIDIFDTKGAQWFWNIYKKYAELGISGWWGDLGEPEVHPSDLYHATGTADELHNIYGHEWAKLIFEGYRKEFSDQRPFILMRAGYSGSQRYGFIPWSGDVNRTWGGLKAQPEISLGMGLQGIAYMHSDLGGFAGANLDDELYTRWLQYGVFQPIYRPHAQEEVASEPVYRSDKAMKNAKASIELRYRMLPYNYTLVFENNQKGSPLMRPLFFEEPQNPKLLNYDATYLWGKNILVSPVLEKGLKNQEVYFPKNSNWYHFYTNKKYSGGTTVSVPLTESHIPTFVRGGSFIPLIATIQNTEQYNLKEFDLHFYHDPASKESEDLVYNDDGIQPNAFENGAYELLKFKSEHNSGGITFRVQQIEGDTFQSSEKKMHCIIHNLMKKPSSVNNYEFFWDEKECLLKFDVLLDSGSNTKIIDIKF